MRTLGYADEEKDSECFNDFPEGDSAALLASHGASLPWTSRLFNDIRQEFHDENG
ncbi:hypothetical protein HMPREF0043_01496 [Actinobaculum sp. oral taxon 183 str. F0552]|nr:hypothetical protein HMPREF0043_01496 [Actinobaculum sp. oral taxon 183 str. F0552]